VFAKWKLAALMPAPIIKIILDEATVFA
jgi:hypothetical protein